jgi:hypothetical protein
MGRLSSWALNESRLAHAGLGHWAGTAAGGREGAQRVEPARSGLRAGACGVGATLVVATGSGEDRPILRQGARSRRRPGIASQPMPKTPRPNPGRPARPKPPQLLRRSRHLHSYLLTMRCASRAAASARSAADLERRAFQTVTSNAEGRSDRGRLARSGPEARGPGGFIQGGSAAGR